jgi:hypothetical protein
MRDIQSFSAMLFFLLVHACLSRFSSLFCILTSIVPVILDKDTKANIYATIYQIVYPDHGGLGMRILKKKGMDDLSTKFKPAKYEELRSL